MAQQLIINQQPSIRLKTGLTALVLDNNGSCCGRRSAGSSLVVRHHSELILIAFNQVLYLKPGGVHISPITPEGHRKDTLWLQETIHHKTTLILKLYVLL